MRKVLNIKLGILICMLLSTISCSIEDIKPINKLTEDSVITNEASAEAMLNAAYTPFREFRMGNFLAGQMVYGGEMDVSFGFFGDDGFDINDVLSENVLLADAYTALYRAINNANFLIDILERRDDLDITEDRANELIAEAKTIRAFGHFMLLRQYGQYFDTNADLGIVLQMEPARTNKKKPRNTVQECYDAIIDDLVFASNNGPKMIPHYRMSATMAKAMLSKAYLYAGDYSNAATTAMEVINNTDGYALSGNFADVFLNNWGEEILFSPYANYTGEAIFAHWSFSRNSITPSTYLRALADKQDGVVGDGDMINNSSGYDNRFIYAFNIFDTAGTNGNGKVPHAFNSAGVNTFIYLRMAEVYLIYAEAEARRPGGDLTVALDQINIIRTRAGMPLKTLSDAVTLLEDIREEKMLELFSETGESIFDLVRYHKLGDITASTVKSTLTNEDKMILPLPIKALSGNDKLVQNPGYK